MNIRAWIYNSKHKKLSSDPQNPPKNPGVVYACHSSSGGCALWAEISGSVGACQSAVLAKLVDLRVCLKKICEEWWRKIHEADLWLLHACIHLYKRTLAYMCTHMNTCISTQKKNEMNVCMKGILLFCVENRFIYTIFPDYGFPSPNSTQILPTKWTKEKEPEKSTRNTYRHKDAHIRTHTFYVLKF